MKIIMCTSYEDVCTFMIMYCYIFLDWGILRRKL